MPGIDNVSVHLGGVQQRTLGKAETRQQRVSAAVYRHGERRTRCGNPDIAIRFGWLKRSQ
jgi:hypothetical protein